MVEATNLNRARLREIIEGETVAQLERNGSMTVEEVVQFLLDHGARRMEAFVPGKTILCALPNLTRTDHGPYGGERDPEKRPCVARLSNPVKYDEHPNGDGHFLLSNHGDQVDYYAILNDGTGKCVKSSFSARAYVVRPEHLFEPLDDIFPRANPPVRTPKQNLIGKD